MIILIPCSESVGRCEEQSLGVSLSTGLDTEITGDEKEKLRRVPSRGCLTTNVDMLTLKVRSVSQDVSSNAFARLTTGIK